MKTFNKYFLSILACGLLSFTACTDEVEYEPAPAVDVSCPGAYFVALDGFDSSTNTYSYEFDPESDTQITLTVGRENTESAATVNLVITSDTENIFEYPATVSFEAGQEQVPVTISFPNAEVGVEYSFNLTFAEGDCNPYNKLAKICVEVIRIKWNEIATGDYLYTAFFTGTDSGLTLYRVDSDPTRYKITNWGGGVDFEFTYDESTNGVLVNYQPIGYVDSNYGDVYVVDTSTYTGLNTYSSYYEDGVFHFNVYYVVSAGYFGFGEETFTITSGGIE